MIALMAARAVLVAVACGSLQPRRPMSVACTITVCIGALVLT